MALIELESKHGTLPNTGPVCFFRFPERCACEIEQLYKDQNNPRMIPKDFEMGINKACG